MTLPFFDGANYTLTRESPEFHTEFRETGPDGVRAGWELRVPEPGPDGVPFVFIFVGATAEHRGSAFRLHIRGKGGEVPDDATVRVETYYKSGSERSLAFEGPCRDLKSGPAGLQRRVEAGQDYVMRVGVTVPAGAPEPDPWHDESSFEIECVKIWWNETA